MKGLDDLPPLSILDKTDCWVLIGRTFLRKKKLSEESLLEPLPAEQVCCAGGLPTETLDVSSPSSPVLTTGVNISKFLSIESKSLRSWRTM